MSEQPESGEKTEQPTAKKLLDARKEGNIPKSNDLTTAIALLGLILSLNLVASSEIYRAVEILAYPLSNPEGLLGDDRRGPTAPHFSLAAIDALKWIFIIPAIAATVAIFAQRSFHFAPKKLAPRLNKISPLTSLKNKFGRSGLFEFSKSGFKMIAVSVLIAVFLSQFAGTIMATSILDPIISIQETFEYSLSFMVIACCLLFAIGAIDLGWQHYDHIRKNLMSQKEIQDEHKEAEGDPHIKNQRRQRGYDIAMNQMLSDVPDSSVVIVNPTHYAVALKWEPLSGQPPICVAKGVDEIAARIRMKANEANVPIFHSPATARSIYAKVEIGGFIHEGDYRAVAAAIKFAQDMRKA